MIVFQTTRKFGQFVHFRAMAIEYLHERVRNTRQNNELAHPPEWVGVLPYYYSLGSRLTSVGNRTISVRTPL